MRFLNSQSFRFYVLPIPFLVCLVVLFSVDPWYFLQDDNYSQFTPTLISGFELWYQGKGFPTYNVFQSAGVPTASYSTYAFINPVSHVSFLVSKYVLGNAYYFNNVFSCCYFFIGYYSFFFLLRLNRASYSIALLSSLLFVFCGFNLMGSRSWYYMAPTIGLFPLLFLLVSKWSHEKLTVKRIALLTVIWFSYIHSGNIQMLIYSILLITTYLFLNTRSWKLRFRTLRFLCISFLLPAILSFPFLLTTYLETRDLNRNGCGGCGISPGFFPLLGIPVGAPFPCALGTPALRKFDAQFYHGGGILLLLTFLFVLYRLIRNYKRFFGVFALPGNCLAVLFSFSFLMALGDSGYVWNIQCQFPILKAFTMPIKFLLFTQFFGVLIGAKVISVYFFYGRYKIAKGIFLVGMSIYLLIHISESRQALFAFQYKDPYPKAAWHEKLNTPAYNRVLSISPARSWDLNYETTLNHNFPSSYGFMSILGYEPLDATGVNSRVDYSKFAIRYIVVSKHAPELWGFDSEAEFHSINDWQKFDTVYSEEKILVLENTDFDEMLCAYNLSGTKIPVEFESEIRADGMNFLIKKTAQMPSKLMLNFMHRPGIRVYLDDQEVEVKWDDYYRVNVDCNVPIKKVRLRYDPYSLKFYKYHFNRKK